MINSSPIMGLPLFNARRACALLLAVLAVQSAQGYLEITVGSSQNPIFTEGAGPVRVEPLLEINSSVAITECKVSITYELGTRRDLQQDILAANSAQGLTVTAFNSLNKELFVRGTSSAANYKLVLQTLTFNNPTNNLANTQRHIVYDITNAGGERASVTRNLDIALVPNVPEINLTTTVVTFREGQPASGTGPVYVAADAEIVDQDSVNIKGFSVQISGGYERGVFGDELIVTGEPPEEMTDLQGNVIGLVTTWDPETATYSVKQAQDSSDCCAPVVYQGILRTVAFNNPSSNPQTQNRTISIWARDDGGEGPKANVTLMLQAVNQVPVVTLASVSVLTIAELQVVTVVPGIQINDIDNTTLKSARMGTFGLFETGKDFLLCPDKKTLHDITCAFDVGSGMLTLTGEAPLANYSMALGAVNYTSRGGASQSGQRIFRIFVNDGADDSVYVQRIVMLQAINNGPFVIGETADGGYYGNGPYLIQPNVTVTDADDVTVRNATVRITEGYDPSTDEIPVPTIPFGYQMECRWNATSAVLACVGVETPEHYQEVLRNVSIKHSGTSRNTSRVFVVEVFDKDEASYPLERRMWAYSFIRKPEIHNSTMSVTAGETVTVSGANFGPRFPSVVNWLQIGGEECANVTVTVDDTELTCVAPAGVGANVTMSIRVNDVDSENRDIFNYKPPTVSLVSNSVNTTGGMVFINGTNFGVIGSSNIGQVNLDRVLCRDPTVTIPHIQIACHALPGAGKAVSIILTIGGQSSGTTGLGKFEYNAPIITSVVSGSLAGFTATIRGFNFGPAGTGYNPTVFFENAQMWSYANHTQYQFECTDAVVTIAHNVLTCKAPPMFKKGGASQMLDTDYERQSNINYTTIVHIENWNSGYDNKSSGFSTMRYIASTITNVTQTSIWGGYITITGTNLGLAGTEILLDFLSDSSSPIQNFRATKHNTMYGETSTTMPMVTVDQTKVYLYIPDYVTTGGLFNPFLRLNVVINDETAPASLASPPFQLNAAIYELYEQPVITGNVSGSAMGVCFDGGPSFGTPRNRCQSDGEHTIYLQGRNFAPNVNYNTSLHYVRQTDQSINHRTFTQVYIANSTHGAINDTPNRLYSPYGEHGFNNTIWVYNSTMLVFNSWPGGIINQQLDGPGRIDGGPTTADITVLMLCTQSTGLGNCASSRTTGEGRWSYLAPEFSATDPINSKDGSLALVPGAPKRSGPTDGRGTEITISGKFFGGHAAYLSANGDQIQGTTFFDSVAFPESGVKICANADCSKWSTCNSSNVATNAKANAVSDGELRCTLGESSDAGTPFGGDVIVTQGNMRSNCTGCFYFNDPVLISMTSAPAAGGVITVTGESFGLHAESISVKVYANKTTFNCTIVELFNHTTFTCMMDPGMGNRLQARVTITSYTGIAQYGEKARVYSYKPPEVFSVSAIPTAGGLVTITGRSFGTDVSLIYATLDGAVLSNIVLIDDETIIGTHPGNGCDSGGCVGSGIKLYLKVDEQENNTTIASYANPTITAVQGDAPTVFGPGTITIEGTNFGLEVTNSSFITLNATGAPIATFGNCKVTTAHTVITCTSYGCLTSSDADQWQPCGDDARNLTVTIGPQNRTVNSSDTGAGLLTFGGPIIVQAFGSSTGSDLPGMISMFAGSSDPLIVVGKNFGSAKKTNEQPYGYEDGSQIASVQFCKKPTSAECTGKEWVDVLYSATEDVDESTAEQWDLKGSVAKTVRNTRMTMRLPAGYGGNHSLLISLGVGGRMYNTTTTGDSIITRYLGPNITYNSDNAFKGYYCCGNESANVPISEFTDTVGGKNITVQGDYFGPVGTDNLMALKWGTSVYRVDQILMHVTEENHFLRFLVPGTGNPDPEFDCGNSCVGTQKFQIGFRNKAGNDHWTTEMEFTYEPPSLRRVSTVPTMGGTMTVTGSSFGPVGPVDDVQVKYRTANWDLATNCTNARVTVASEEIQCTMPAGTGVDYYVRVWIGGQKNLESDDRNRPARWLDYADPEIYSITNIDTNYNVSASSVHRELGINLPGPWVTIRGKNFGPAGNDTGWMADDRQTRVGEVSIGGAPCNYPVVTVIDEEVQCMLGTQYGSGSGVDYDVILNISFRKSLDAPLTNQTANNTGIFSYNLPRFTAIPLGAGLFGGELVTVYGENFGCSADNSGCVLPVNEATSRRRNLLAHHRETTASATINGIECTEVKVTSHTTITLRPPDASRDAVIYNLPFSLTVEGNTIANTPTYNYSGPTIVSVSEASIFGGEVTVTGTNFGPTARDGADNIWQIAVGETILDYDVANPRVTKEGNSTLEGEIVFYLPPGRGVDLNLVMQIGYKFDVTCCPQSTGSSGYGMVTYAGPRIVWIQGGDTAGGIITIYGRNFGEVGPQNIQSAIVNGAPCEDATVTQNGDGQQFAELTCIVIPGTGGPYDASLRISDETDLNTGLGKYNYSVPVIDVWVPKYPEPGEQIVINGSAYGNNIDVVEVTIGGIPCANLRFLNFHQSLTCTTPYTTGFDFALQVRVGALISAPGSFAYAPPEVFTASMDTNALGGTVTITGRYFGPAGSDYIDSVKLGSAQCKRPTVSKNDTEIICEAPEANVIGYGRGQFSLADLDGDGRMLVNVTIAGQHSEFTGDLKFSFAQCTVEEITPTTNLYGNDQVIVRGRNFGNRDNADCDLLNEADPESLLTPCILDVFVAEGPARSHALVTNNLELTFAMPYNLGAFQDFSLTINGRACDLTDVMGQRFVYGPPYIDARTIKPLVIPGTQGGTATFWGKGFGPVGTKYLQEVEITTFQGTIPCTNASVTEPDSQITCTVDEGEGRDHDVKVTVAGQDSGESGIDAFSYAAPVVDRVFPRTVTLGTPIQLFGSNFGTDKSKISIYLQHRGHTPDQGFECYDVDIPQRHYRVNCKVGVGVGNGVLPIIDVGGNNNSISIRANASSLTDIAFNPPFVESVSSSTTQGGRAAVGGNGPVAITGRNFGPAGTEWIAFFDRVLLNGVECTDAVVTVDDTEIQCIPPPGTGKDHDVLVSMGGLDSGESGIGKFSYLNPVVSSMTSLPTTGGTATIYGANFGPPSRNATVLIFGNGTVGERCTAGKEPASFAGDGGCEPLRALGAVTDVEVKSDTELTCNVGAGTGKNYDVRVFLSALGSGATGDDAFSFQRPVVMSVLPNVQPTNSDDSFMITIKGLNFGRSPEDVGKVDVKIGERFCNRSLLNIVPPYGGETLTKIFAVPPYGAGVDLPVRVVVDKQESDFDPGQTFSYFAPVVFSVDPVPTAGGIATIHGDNFGPSGPIFQVLIDSDPCVDAMVTVQDYVIECTAPPGTGNNKDVFVRMSNTSTINSADTGVNKFRYEAPVIERVNPRTAKTGDPITITGVNFGSVLENIRLDFAFPDSMGGYLSGIWSSTQYEMLAPHTKFRAYVPVGFGKGLRVMVNVNGQYMTDYNTTDPQKRYDFTYSEPKILLASSVPTAGGTLTVTGQDLGSTDPGAVDFVQIRTWRQEVVECANPVVTVDSTEVQCELPEGEGGKSLDVRISTGGQNSSWTKVFRYQEPIVIDVSPRQAAFGDRVTVTGANFGNNHTLFQFWFNQVNESKLIAKRDFNLTVNHTQVVFTVPVGVGPQRDFRFLVPVEAGVQTWAQSSINDLPQAGKNTSVTMSYLPPVVYRATDALTRGGNITIYGTNFGPMGSANVNEVKVLGDNRCENPEVTVENTELNCTVVEGTGANLSVIVRIGGLRSEQANVYTYSQPIIYELWPTRGFPGDPIELGGISFGDDKNVIEVHVGGVLCGDVQILTEHTRIRCTVGAGLGGNQSIVVTTNGVEGPLISEVKFVYQKAGCTTKGSSNYDETATDDDGSCAILGCTQAEASNFNPFANVNDGSCVREPEVVSMKVKLDYSEYLSKPAYYDEKFLTDVSNQLNISKDRLLLQSVTEGSTVFLFRIVDDPDDRAQDVAIRMEQMILKNEWNMDQFTLLQMKWEDSPLGTVDTKEDEPHVSTGSIVAVVVAAVVIVLWALFWRRALLKCAQKCCGDDYEEDVEQQLMMEGMLDRQSQAPKSDKAHSVKSGQSRGSVAPAPAASARRA